MHFQKLLPVLILSLTVQAVQAEQSEISAKLGRMSDNLVAGYSRAPGAKVKPKAAVLTFNTSKELEKQRIGFAVSEMLSHNLAGKGAFTLLERTDLNRVFEELKLSMSGVTDQAEAIKAGKVASADILVMGSVEKFGATYHINSRLVQTETGEVLATAYEELPVSVFEEEAREYVILVPKTQMIGVYFPYNYRRLARVPPTTTITTFTDMNGSTDLIAATAPNQPRVWTPGLGLSYAPFEHFMFDLAYINTGRTQKPGLTRRIAVYPGPVISEYDDIYHSGFSALRALAGPKVNLSRSLSCFIGAGATSVRMFGDGHINYITASALARIEFHPQERIGISVSAGYDLTTKKSPLIDYLGAQIGIMRLPNFYVEPSIAIYF